MRSFPLPVRVAAGVAATVVERTRELPGFVAGLPLTIASQTLQTSMRVQQQLTELAIKGDAALAELRPTEEQPEWATFDEDIDPGGKTAPDGSAEGDYPPEGAAAAPDDELRVMSPGPSRLPEYDSLSMPQLRGKLRALSEADLSELLRYERAHLGRAEFERMLHKRLERLRADQG